MLLLNRKLLSVYFVEPLANEMCCPVTMC